MIDVAVLEEAGRRCALVDAAIEERRFKLVSIAVERLLDLLTGRARIVNIPEGSRLACVHFDPCRDLWIIRVAHPSFEPVAPGQMIPVFAEAQACD